jgi:hypothetical protein
MVSKTPPPYEVFLEVHAQYSKAARNPFNIRPLIESGWRVIRQKTISYNPPEALLIMY